MVSKENLITAWNDFHQKINRGELDPSMYIKGSERPQSDKLHCSQCGRCPRATVMARAGFEKAATQDASARNFNNGRLLESLVVAAFDAMPGVNCVPQVPVRHPAGELVGTMDMLIHDPADNTYTILDCKSCHERKLDYGFDEGYRKQVATYAWCRELAGEPVNYTGVVYVNKSTWLMTVDFFDWTRYRELMETWVKDAREQYDNWVSGKVLPAEIPFTRSKKGGMVPAWTCTPRWCDYARHCPDVMAYWQQHGTQSQEG